MSTAQQPRSGFASINGAQIWYDVTGSGHPLVLTHAGIADHRMWDDQVAAFAPHYQVIRWDMRGFGQTQMVAGSYSSRNDLYELLRFLGIERTYLMGCSMGGSTIIDLTLEHPELVAALIPVAAGVNGFEYTGEPPKQFEEVDAACQAGDFERASELEVQVWVDGPQRTPDQVDPHVRDKVRAMNLIALQAPEGLGKHESLAPPAVGRLGEIKVPALLIVGDLDQPDVIRTADLLAAEVPQAQKVVMHGTAHLPNLEQPAEFNRIVLDFLGKLT
ncbi:MAG: alpha/beta fold hydrolase [Herpetosiphonaceae bacterium]|nr:alpha/beta fold hydrolase [Herpetosiphonaceae bacterium]